jgi:hypothetical protein
LLAAGADANEEVDSEGHLTMEKTWEKHGKNMGKTGRVLIWGKRS